ncbi:uncharacterized protein LOC119071794 [Bradysia coprophila]|uniref:uncharacterized protein LOC119071794 n=1 Tax=Bradysia coprophila TaxID=38358 RepID=UPI00187DB17B|nr:uncharacterized protein LOC119071794 [Bradysia coprophila]
MSLRIRVVRTFQQGFKPYRHYVLRQIVVHKHTSAATDEFKENKHLSSETSVDDSSKLGQRKSQTAIDIEIIKLESKLLKEMLSTKDALIHSKDALIDSKNALIQSKDVNLEKEMVIRGYLESELLAVKHKLHCRGVIERFETLRTSPYVGQPKMTRSATWQKILSTDLELQRCLSELKGFPSSVSPSSTPIVLAKLVTEFYRRLSNDIHRDPSGQTMCVINKSFCSDWEMGFMVKICSSIPVRHKVENADQ